MSEKLNTVDEFQVIPVEDFIRDCDNALQAMAGYDELIDSKRVLKEKKYTGIYLNDLRGKLILGHIFGEDIAKLFRNWIRKNYPCQEDLDEARAEALRIEGEREAARVRQADPEVLAA